MNNASPANAAGLPSSIPPDGQSLAALIAVHSKAYAACSNMPRFGHANLLTEQQIRDLMALLLDPKSPVNE